MNTSELVDVPSVCKLLGGVHRSTLHRWIASGRFPPPIKLNAGTARWRVGEIEAFIEKAASERALMIGRAS